MVNPQHQYIDDELVSVIMPCYNGAKYIRDAIESVQAQSHENWELIVIDDASTDNSADIIREKAADDTRIKYFRNEENSGVSVGRNKAIEKARGRYIAFLDADDIYLSQKLETQLSFMKSNDAGFCFSWYNIMDENGEHLDSFTPNVRAVTYDKLLCHNYVGLLTVMIDRKKLASSDSLRFITIPANEDYALWLKIVKELGKGYCINEILADYRLVSGSISSNKIKVAKNIWKIFHDIEGFSLAKTAYCFTRYLVYYCGNKLRFINYRSN